MHAHGCTFSGEAGRHGQSPHRRGPTGPTSGTTCPNSNGSRASHWGMDALGPSTAAVSCSRHIERLAGLALACAALAGPPLSKQLIEHALHALCMSPSWQDAINIVKPYVFNDFTFSTYSVIWCPGGWIWVIFWCLLVALGVTFSDF